MTTLDPSMLASIGIRIAAELGGLRQLQHHTLASVPLLDRHVRELGAPVRDSGVVDAGEPADAGAD